MSNIIVYKYVRIVNVIYQMSDNIWACHTGLNQLVPTFITVQP